MFVLTGTVKAGGKRDELWHSKRVLFCTPQLVQSDINKNIVPLNRVVLVVCI